jgi:hypothetical protein
MGRWPRLPGGAIAVLAVLGGAACGATAQSAQGPPAQSTQGPFVWLKSQQAPREWSTTRIPVGATLAYPPGWHVIHGDAGTATAALVRSDGSFLGYLNVTPRQGPEKLSGWSAFRIAHNADEGDRNVTELAAATRLRFLDGRGSCVKDSYSTQVGSHYIEIACIVQGSKSTSVIVAAAPPGSWTKVSPQLERAIESFRA